MYGEQTWTGNVYCVVCPMNYSHHGHNEMIHVCQKLCYTEFGNMFKKTIFPQDSPPKIHIEENP